MMQRAVALAFFLLIVTPYTGIIASAQGEALHIETPPEVVSGERFKVVVTEDNEPASYAVITFQGAVVEPATTDKNGVAVITAPNVAKPTKIDMTAKKYYEEYGYATITVLPTKETREEEIIKRSTTLFEGKIMIVGNGYWSSKYSVPATGSLVIEIKTDGHPINEYVLTQKSYSNYLENRIIYMDDYYQYNVVEGRYIIDAKDIYAYSDPVEAYVVFENPHNETVSVSVSISRTNKI